MGKHITLKVFRFDPDVDQDPRFQEYRMAVEGRSTVLMLLDRIQREVDPSLSFRDYCCGLQTCRSCLLKINKKTKMACMEQVAPGDRLTIEPVSFPERHVKDLVVMSKERT
jgi:succinate dehydrogenase/fumarate reductase-like Fe-S protein